MKMKLFIFPDMKIAKRKMLDSYDLIGIKLNKSEMKFECKDGFIHLYRCTQWISQQKFQSYKFVEIHGVEFVQPKDMHDLKRRLRIEE